MSLIRHAKKSHNGNYIQTRKTEKFKDVVISHDMTKLEREQCKKTCSRCKTAGSPRTFGGIYFQSQGATRKHESCQVEKTNVNKLNVLFTNADSLMNKRTDLEIFIGEQLHKPDIIGIVEKLSQKIVMIYRSYRNSR